MDRGTMDTRAYVTEDDWQMILEENDWSNWKLRDERYDLIVHLVTAADGAEEFYTLSNNKARSESPLEARQLDERLRMAYLGHNLRIIDNSSPGGFKSKIRRVMDCICQSVGLPYPGER